jgi:hypothetical protein
MQPVRFRDHKEYQDGDEATSQFGPAAVAPLRNST